jgi:high-affinity iron transporter
VARSPSPFLGLQFDEIALIACRGMLSRIPSPVPAAMKATLLSLLCALLFVGGCYSDTPSELPEAKSLLGQPLTMPVPNRAKVLFVEHCAACHGDVGHGDGWQVPKLEGPRPRDFHKASMMAAMSPSRAYTSITVGVPRTSMGDFTVLSDRDRWHLAFYVLSLGYDSQDASQGQVAFGALGLGQPRARTLATLTNASILEDLNKRVADEATSQKLLAYLRTLAPYHGGDAPLSRFRQGLSGTIETYRRGDHDKAQLLLKDAELNHLTSHLNIVRMRDSGLSLAAEQEVHNLRALLSEGAPIRQIEERAQTLAASLDLADPLLSRKLSAGIGAAQTASVVFSFAIDGALCLFLLLVLASRRGSDRSERRAVGLGLIVGLLLTVASWLAWSTMSELLPGGLRTTLSLVLSGLVALLSIPLLIVTIRHFRSPPQHRLRAPISWLALLFILSGGILFRDALEVIPAMTIIASFSTAAVLGFVGAGIALVGMVSLLVALERRMSIAPRTGLLCMSITLIAVMAIGGTLRAAQQLGLLNASPAGSTQSPWLCMWPTEEGVIAQLAIAALCTLTIMVSTILRPEPAAVPTAAS